jgi:hypothetical protein
MGGILGMLRLAIASILVGIRKTMENRSIPMNFEKDYEFTYFL